MHKNKVFKLLSSTGDTYTRNSKHRHFVHLVLTTFFTPCTAKVLFNRLTFCFFVKRYSTEFSPQNPISSITTIRMHVAGKEFKEVNHQYMKSSVVDAHVDSFLVAEMVHSIWSFPSVRSKRLKYFLMNSRNSKQVN